MHAQPRFSVCDSIALTNGTSSANGTKRTFGHRDHAPVDNDTAATAMQGLSVATIDLAAIAHNTALIAKAAGNARVMAVVKANGFGHGAAQVAPPRSRMVHRGLVSRLKRKRCNSETKASMRRC
jgi:hypothetical protein